MKLGFSLVLFGVLTIGFSKVTCLTNRELYEFISEYGEEVQPTSSWADDDTADDDVIDLTGDLDDDVDITYLLKRLGMQPEKKYVLKTDACLKQTERFWHHHHHHHRPEFHCSCSKDKCKCCITHKFKFFMKSFKLAACMELSYKPDGHHFSLDFTLNGHSLYKHEVSLKHLFERCFGIPGLGSLGKVCLDIYDIDLQKIHACAKLTGAIDIKIHKFSIHLKLGCFSIPKSELGGYFQLADKRSRVHVDLLPGSESDEAKSRDLSENFRKLQAATESEEDGPLKY